MPVNRVPMQLYMTPAMTKAAYELLRTTPPFRGWKLPHADEFHFIVRDLKGDCGRITYKEGQELRFYLCTARHGKLDTLLWTVAHEMCHIKLILSGHPDWDKHDHQFDLLADRVCKHHGFDRTGF